MYGEKWFITVAFWLILCEHFHKIKVSGHASAEILILNKNNALCFVFSFRMNAETKN